MNDLWTVWSTNDDMEPLLVGIATSEEKAYKMREKIKEEFEDAFEVQVCKMPVNTLTIDEKAIHFDQENEGFEIE